MKWHELYQADSGEIALSEPILLRDQTALKRLAERLSQCLEVTKYDQGDEKEAGVLAHSFADLEESFRMFLQRATAEAHGLIRLHPPNSVMSC